MPFLQPSSPVLPQDDATARKRTTSFSYSATAFAPNPRPAKSPRTTTMGSALRRTESIYDLSEPSTSSIPLPSIAQSVNDARHSSTILTLNRFKERRLQRLAAQAQKPGVPMTICTNRVDLSQLCVPPQIPPRVFSGRHYSAVARAPPQQYRKPVFNPRRPLFTLEAPSQEELPPAASPITSKYYHRNTSPLSPNPGPAPRRPDFPRSKRQPNLRRAAVKNIMDNSPEWRRVFTMGVRLAYTIETATRDLAAIVGDNLDDYYSDDDEDDDDDVVMVEIENLSASAPPPVPVVPKSEPIPVPISVSNRSYPHRILHLMAPSISPTNSTLAKPVLTASCIIVKGDDWEMIDSTA